MGDDWKSKLRSIKELLFPKEKDRIKQSYPPNRPITKREVIQTTQSKKETIKSSLYVSSESKLSHANKGFTKSFPQELKKSNNKLNRASLVQKTEILAKIEVKSEQSIPPKIKLKQLDDEKINANMPLPEEVSKGKKRITVGLDFGTSTTKVCVRRELGGDDLPIYPIKFKHITDDSPYLCASLVGIDNNKVYFGPGITSGDVYPHLKICVACELGYIENKECVSKEKCVFRDPTTIFRAADFATMFLAWVMKETRAQLPKEFRDSPNFTYNVSIPIKQLDTNPLSKKYRRMVYTAWRISEGLHQGIDLYQVLGWIKALESNELPSPEESYVHLCPETIAAIISYERSSNALPGLYSIVDIGAWTTDISFFRLTDIDADRTGVNTVSFYDADVFHVATNMIDINIIHALMKLCGIKNVMQFMHANFSLFIKQCRENNNWKEKVSFKTESGKTARKSIPAKLVAESKNAVSEDVLRFFGETFKKAFQKEKVLDRWNNISLFIIGGGSREKIFGEKIIDLHRNRLKIKSIKFGNLEDKKASSIHYRLAVAAGLSYPVGDWPDQFRPSEVSNWERKKPKYIPDRDEQYPK